MKVTRECVLWGRCRSVCVEPGDNRFRQACRRPTNGMDLKSSVMFVHRFTHLSTDHIVMWWEVPIGSLNPETAVMATKGRCTPVRWCQVRTSVSTADAPVSPGSEGLPTGGVRISPAPANLRVCEVLPMALSSRARSTRASVFLARRAVVGSGRTGR